MVKINVMNSIRDAKNHLREYDYLRNKRGKEIQHFLKAKKKNTSLYFIKPVYIKA